MKTSKKILSIVLSVMLLVGTVVVGASAETMVFEKAGSKLVYTATASKEANAEGVIEVEPGETITVSVYAQANYYLGTTGGEIFCWTAGFFNTFATSDVAFSNYVNNYKCTTKVVKSTAATQLGTGYNTGTHEGFQCAREYTTECTAPYDASEATLGYTFTFTVPESATPGATGEFRMPETCSATVATTSRMRQIYAAVNNSDSAYGSQSLGSLYPETIDLTAAVLNFKVAEAEVEVEVPCDYAALDEAIAAAATADTANCTEASVAEFNAALEAANAVERNMIVDEAGENQKIIDDATAALVAAIAGLTKLGACDYAELDAAIADYEAKLADKDLYTNWADYEAAYNAAKAVARDMIADEAGANQKVIDDAADALNAVVLEYKAADYTDVDAAIEEAAQVDRSKYTAVSLKKLDDAIAAVVTGLNITHQAEVRDMAQAIRDAIANLVPLGACDYTALDAAIAAYEAKLADKDLYANWADYEAAYDAAKAVARDMIADEAGANQKVIDDAAAALNAVVLKYKAADYTAVEAAKAKIPADLSIYTAASVKAVEDAVAAVVEGYDITKQAEVDKMAADIEDAVAKLAPLGACDYTALDAALALVPAADADAYTEETWKAYAAAKADAEAIERDMIADEAGANQAAINAAAQALADAYNALELKPIVAIITNVTPKQEYFEIGDIVEFDYLCSMTGITKIQNVYSSGTTTTYTRNDSSVIKITDNGDGTETWTIAVKIFDDSVTATAKAKLGKIWEEGGYPFSYQTKENPDPSEDVAVKSVTILNNDVAVDGFTTKDTVVVRIVAGPDTLRIRLVTEGGSTSTYTRDMAYQDENGNWVWDITTRRTTAADYKFDIYTAGSDNKLVDEGTDLTYTVTAPVVVEDVAVKSVTILNNDVAVDSFTTKDTVVVRIVAGSDTLRIRLVSAGGSTSTYTRDKAYQDENGNWVWDITTRRTTAAEYKFDIYTAGKSNKLVDEGTDLTYTVTAPVVVVGPSTGNDADIVVSATLAKARLLVGDKQTVTVVTDKDALGVRIVDAEGDVHYQTKDTALAVDNGDGTLTWTFNVACAVEGTYTFDVQALYVNQWMSNGTEITYKVVY